MSNLTHPPIPKRLREVLKDYPEYLEQLQRDLNDFAEHAEQGPQLFENAAWALELTLEGFMSDALKERSAAEASGDVELIARKKEKARVMIVASAKRTWLGDESFGSYFHVNRDASK